ncbi:hypothetical protein [Arcanobacterium phocae]|uniref:hypothetical protein n=1 Tax=Arcanobacterium phocae TaxID=131112 RepID=UPI001C0EB31F|nr:hypothetical protein [Arcanobacterium phocae]
MTWQTEIERIGARIRSEHREALFEEADDFSQAEHASVYLSQRIRGSLGKYVNFYVGDRELSGVLIDSGADWFTYRSQLGVEIVSLNHVWQLSGLSLAVSDDSRYVPTLNSILRRLIGSHIVVNRCRKSLSGELLAVGCDYIVILPSASVQAAGYEMSTVNGESATEIYMPIKHISTVSSRRGIG